MYVYSEGLFFWNVVKERGELKGEKGHTDGFIHAQNQTACLHGRLDCVDLHQAGLPNKRLHVVSDTFIVEVDPGPRVALAMLHTQLGEDVGGVKPGVITQLSGDDLEGFCERLYNRLLLTRYILIREFMKICGDFHL